MNLSMVETKAVIIFLLFSFSCGGSINVTSTGSTGTDPPTPAVEPPWQIVTIDFGTPQFADKVVESSRHWVRSAGG
jgi:hypothetical protein